MPTQPPAALAIERVIADEARQTMAREIAAVGGREVYFVGQTEKAENGSLLVTQVEAVARGDHSSVPAIMHQCRWGDVVIHNHPGGNLAPSQADIGIASTLGAMGVGFFIINCAADEVYVVVKAFEVPQITQLDMRELVADLAPNGRLAKRLDDYEHRPAQMQMLEMVTSAFNDNMIAVIEAGTGTGKSLAYLLPAIRWARVNKQRVVISTSTINLQEQLIHKDLPFLRQHLGEEFDAVLVKGRGNYLCRRKLEEVKREAKHWDFERPESADQMREVIAWAEKTEEGCTSDLAFLPNREVWERVESHADTTLRVRCPHYEKCFFYQARRRAARADLLVANHSLLMSDLSIRMASDNWGAPAVLPPYQRVILDEAHNVEAAATSHFTRQATRTGIARMLGRLIASRRRSAGLIPNLWRKVCDAMLKANEPGLQVIADMLEGALKERRFQVGEEVAAAFDRIEDAVVEHLGRELRRSEEVSIRLTETFEAGPHWREVIRPSLEVMAREIEDLVQKIQSALRACDGVSDKAAEILQAAVIELRAQVNSLAETASTLRFLARGLDSKHCHWVSLKSGGRRESWVTLAAAPLSVAQSLRRALFERFATVTLTSATLAVAGKFDYLARTLGLEGIGDGRLMEIDLPSPFDYERQALVAAVTDLPDPGDGNASEALARVIAPAVMASRGRAFVLFTSYRMLERVAELLTPHLAMAGLRVMRQGETNRTTLLRRFKSDPASVLFATASFWEGVDVKGEGLVNLILTKLPFQVPTEPLLEARQEAIVRDGGDPFNELLLPQAVIKFKQGFGRLIRHRSDRGCVLILDSRVVRRGYGQTFLRSLPAKSVKVMSEREMVEEVNGFFAT